MEFHEICNSHLKTSRLDKFVEVIYKNFENLSEFPNLKHNRSELFRLCRSNNAKIYIVTYNKKMISYLIGEIMYLNDGRKVFYVAYIYTAGRFRGQGIASELMKITEEYTKNYNLDGVLLTCDTNDYNVYKFYSKRGYMPDLILRNNTRHEILFR